MMMTYQPWLDGLGRTGSRPLFSWWHVQENMVSLPAGQVMGRVQNPVNLRDFQPIVERAEFADYPKWCIGVCVALIVVCLTSLAICCIGTDTTRGEMAAVGTAVVSGLVVVAMVVPYVSTMSRTYQAFSITQVIEQRAQVTDLRCEGLGGMPSVEQYKRDRIQPWPSSSDTMFSCTWRDDSGQAVAGKVRLVPKLRYWGFSFFSESGSVYSDGIKEAILLNKDDTVWGTSSGHEGSSAQDANRVPAGKPGTGDSHGDA